MFLNRFDNGIKGPGGGQKGLRPRDSGSVSALLLIELQKVLMHKPFCSSSSRRRECISAFVHRALESANVSALLLIELEKA